MALHCTHCQSTDLKKVSFVYEEGLFEIKARTRFHGFLLETSGPDLIAGHAYTNGVVQRHLSKKLHPPLRWSYLKPVGWFVLSCFVALIGYAQWVMSKPGTASLLPLAVHFVVASCLLVSLELVIWRHNHLVYPSERTRWERSFLCMICGGVSQSLRTNG